MASIKPLEHGISELHSTHSSIDIETDNNIHPLYVLMDKSKQISFGSRFEQEDSTICSVLILFFAILLIILIIQLTIYVASE